MPAIIISPGTVVDSAGIGAIAPLGAKYFAGPGIIHCVGDPVSGHSSGASTHPTNVIATGSTKVTAGGRPVAVLGLSFAACTGPVVTTPNPKVLFAL